MAGIISYGGYIPRLRLDRMSVYQEMGWSMPATIMVAQGERSVCNWDEDSLTMAVAASRDCLQGQDRSRVGALYLGSTTLPFADRQCAGLVKTALNLPDAIETCDFTSSLKAGTGALIAALAAAGAGSDRRVLVTASDHRQTRAGGFYEMWFGDGAASLLVGDDDVIAEFAGSHSVSHDFVDHVRGARQAFDYTWEERWVRDEGYSRIIPEAVGGLFEKLGITMDDVDQLVFPCFFKAEHRKIAKKLGAGPDKVADNLHEACGECGAAHPLVMFVRALERAEPGQGILLCGFGQGCDALFFRTTEKLPDLAPRPGIQGSLERKQQIDKYARYLRFRDLIEVETGIRGEAPTQTAMTVLWRERDMLTGLVGGKCRACGTAQFPRMDICVNPECRAMRTQDPYCFADRPATVKTYTGDYLAYTIDPPAVYGMIQFEGGGRFMADFTDCRLEEVYVGQPVDMAFRRRYHDEQRGFSGYFWKAVPRPGEKPASSSAESIRFDGQVAVVTGAGGGLGRVYALELARRGCKVVVNDLGGARDGSGSSRRAAEAVVDEIRSAGGEAVASFDSVATGEGGVAIVQTALDSFGRLDILINNAGILRDRSLAKMEEQDWYQVLGVHLEGAFHVTRAAIGPMREQGHGRIVMTTSATGLYGNFGQSNYGAAKMGLVGMMNTLALEGQKYDIKVNTVAPVARTRLTEELLPPDLADRLDPSFVAPLVVYLCSDGCAQTGMVFNAGMGVYNRAAVVAARGVALAEGTAPPDPDDILRNFDAIDALEDPQEYSDAMASLQPMIEVAGSESKS